MEISWINKFTLIDYPWKLACIIFTLWCNFRCWFCHNPNLVLPEKTKEALKDLIPEKAFFNFLEQRKWKLNWVSICGWEPTMQQDLPEFCKKIKDMWYQVKLDTNGQNPKMIEKLLEEELIDYIAMDIKTDIWNYSNIVWVKIKEKKYLKTIEIILNSKIDYEFRTTVIKWFHTEEIIKNISKNISWAKAYFLQNFRPWKTLDKDFLWDSFSSWELKKFKIIAEEHINKVWIRN